MKIFIFLKNAVPPTPNCMCSIFQMFYTTILQCSAVKTPTAPLGRAPVENGDTEDTSPSLTMLLPLICCVIGPMLCKSHSVCSRIRAYASD